MRVVAVIPARYGSTRLPGKPLLRDTGKYLVEHVYERVSACPAIERVIVATEDERVVEAVRSFGGEVELTRPDHATGTERIAEVAAGLGDGVDLILNVQGDEPEIAPEHLERLVGHMEQHPAVPVGTLAAPLRSAEAAADPNCVKVVMGADGRALYFSRSAIPYVRHREVEAKPWLLHIGVYAYRPGLLMDYVSWPAGRLERIEGLEQLRVLERGAPIHVVVVDEAPIGIDTREDYDAFVKRWRASRRRSR